MTLTEKQERLALEIAHALGDIDSLQWHRQMVTRYSEDHLRKNLMKALKVPEKEVRTTRGAIYNSLVQGYAKRSGN